MKVDQPLVRNQEMAMNIKTTNTYYVYVDIDANVSGLLKEVKSFLCFSFAGYNKH